MTSTINARVIPSYHNWKHALNSDPELGAVEAVLYTDAVIIGQIRTGPYFFINTIAHASDFNLHALRQSIVLRVYDYLPEFGLPDMERSDYEHYHGGDLIDEVAALCSLLMGMRVKAGPVTREFRPDDQDQYGRPIGYGYKPEPYLPIGTRRPQIPSLSGQHELSRLSDLDQFPNLHIDDAVALVKSARLYQAAVWIADTDPSTAWLLLVSAIETAAQRYSVTAGSSREAVSLALPDLVSLIETHNCTELLEPLSLMLARFAGSTKKFINFLVDYMPQPPITRPPEYAQFRFDASNMKKAAAKIYGYRSKSLHEGIAFPAPMCWAPSEHMPGEPPFEIHPGLASHTLGATWQAKDAPMLLHTFEYIARNALLAWFKSMTKA